MTTLPPPVDALAAWIGQPIGVDDLRAEAVLSAASNLARGYAGQAWADDEVPDEIGDLVVQVAGRVYLSPANPNIKNRATGPFSEGFFDAAANGLFLTEEEKATLDRYRETTAGLGTISMAGGSYELNTVYVPTAPEPAGYPFPWYAADDNL